MVGSLIKQHFHILWNQVKNLFNISLCWLLSIGFLLGQSKIQGLVTDQVGDPLPYTSIYIQSTSRGTTSNMDGYYSLNVAPGAYQVVFQYVGFRTSIVQVEVPVNGIIDLDVTLDEEPVKLDEVVVRSEGEDPAYAIIRKAIEKRKYHRDLIQSFSCQVYVKGNTKVLYAPEKVFGVEVGDLAGALDSNRQGIVYLSESVSTLYYKAPKQYKEVVTSSKISGDDQGYSFNSAREMNMNFYENTVEMNRSLVSPIAGNALNYYRYQLQSTFTDGEGRLIHKITVKPKREYDPVFYGTVYIVDEQWNFHSLELGVTAQSSQLYFVDSLTFRQIFVPVQRPDIWALFNHSISFKLSGFGFAFAGAFTAVYSDYAINVVLDPKLFNNQVHVVEAESNKRDSTYWASIRPVPLTTEENRDYIRKDSIQKVREDPVYMDSIDRKNNRFKLGNLFGGYYYQRRTKKIYWDVGSPLGAVGFNTVQGFNGDINLNLRKYFNSDETRRILLNSRFNYGFSERRLRVKGDLVYRADRLKPDRYIIGAGRDIRQFNHAEPISRIYNTLYSLFTRENYAKYYDLHYVQLGLTREISGSVLFSGHLEWEERRPLTNNSSYSFFDRKELTYTSNDPLDPFNFSPSFEQHRTVQLDVAMRLRFGQKYVVFPDQRFSTGHIGPTVVLGYRYAFPLSDFTKFHQLRITLDDSNDVGVAGSFSYYVHTGTFFGKQNVQFIDFQHFLGTQTFFTPEDRYHRRFLSLPYYSNSTDDTYVEIHLNHHFDGYLLDKVPGIRKLGLGLVAGARYLKSAGHPSYWEFSLGLDKLGIQFFRLLRFDAAWSINDGKSDLAFRLGLKIN